MSPAAFEGRALPTSLGRHLNPTTELAAAPGETLYQECRRSPADGQTPVTKGFQPRPLGEYLLLAQLGEDALGTVYRALRSGEKDRFVRFRILQSAELSPAAVAAVIEKNRVLTATLSHPAIVPQSQLGIVDGVPYLAWSEPAGWTLDVVLRRLRAMKSCIPLKYALSIAERVAAGLQAAWLTVSDGQPTPHGLLWPGFVSIGGDAEVRVGGFGLAEAVLPSLHKPRLARNIAPYVAPEARGEAKPGSNSDVYSLGVLLLELLTGRRPSLGSPAFELQTGEDLPKEIDAFVRLSLASPAQRFPSVIAMRRVLQEALTASPELAAPADLALYLYNLLNPESRSVATFSDADSTHPVTAEEESVSKEIAEAAVPIAVNPPDAAEPEDASPPERMRPRRRALKVVALVAIAGASTAFFLGSRVLSTPSSWLEARRHPALATAGTSVDRSSPVQGPAPLQAILSEPEGATALSPKERAKTATAARESKDFSAKRPAEDSRFKAALARVEAERFDASEMASELFARGRSTEEQGERLFRKQHYEAAQQAFQKAGNFFQQAKSASREERMRHVKLSSGQ